MPQLEEGGQRSERYFVFLGEFSVHQASPAQPVQDRATGEHAGEWNHMWNPWWNHLTPQEEARNLPAPKRSRLLSIESSGSWWAARLFCWLSCSAFPLSQPGRGTAPLTAREELQPQLQEPPSGGCFALKISRAGGQEDPRAGAGLGGIFVECSDGLSRRFPCAARSVPGFRLGLRPGRARGTARDPDGVWHIMETVRGPLVKGKPGVD